jgi:iron complex transport system substrate-binding protein
MVPDYRSADPVGFADLSKTAARNWSGVFLLALFLAGAAGCGPDATHDSGEESHPPANAPAGRIITLAPHLTELAFAAGAGDRLVGAVEYSDYPAAALDLPRVGDAFRLDYEAIAAMDPDLVFGWRSGTPADVLRRLEELGYRVVALEPERLDSVAEQLRIIGRAAGTVQTAEIAAAEYEGRLARLRNRFRDAAVVSVYYQVSAQPMLTISRRHLIGEAIEVCGGRNIFAGLAELTPAVSVEAVLDRSPEVILVSSFVTRDDALPEGLSFWRDWPNVPAVRDGNLFAVNADQIARPGTRILGGVEQICGYLEAARQKGNGRDGL